MKLFLKSRSKVVKKINKCYIYDFDELNFTNDEVNIISKNTINTWQPDRDETEKKSNTEQGKLAETAVEKLFKDNSVKAVLLPYDHFRADNCLSHAPFDDLLFYSDTVSKSTLDEYIKKICDESNKNSYGKISENLREDLFDNNIYVVEIKSTKVSNRKKANASFTSYEKDEELNALIDEICKDDFLTYPKYLRCGDKNWIQYCEYSKAYDKRLSGLSGYALSCKMKEIELRNMADYYIRVYIDYDNSKVIIMGYIEKNEFMEYPTLKKMPLYGKSENALYLSKELHCRHDLEELFNV